MTEEEERQSKLESIFMPHAWKQRREAYERQGLTRESPHGLKFAHYTSAEAALSILSSKRLWMRNTTCMSDWSEVQHGFEILKSFFDPARTKEFTDTIDTVVPGAAMSAITAFNQWWLNNLPQTTHVASISEHNAKEEDQHGRLSMWRAFGDKPARVALIIQLPHVSEGSEALNITFSPVAYLSAAEVHQQIRDVAANIVREADTVKSLEPESVNNYLFAMLFAGVTCLKHEGFKEEKEWRAVYNDKIFYSPLMEKSLEVVGGVPQHVFKLPMDKSKSPKLADLEVSSILDRVIIGPSPYPWVLYQAFVEALKNAGVAGAEERVRVSGIPIRH